MLGVTDMWRRRFEDEVAPLSEVASRKAIALLGENCREDSLASPEHRSASLDRLFLDEMKGMGVKPREWPSQSPYAICLTHDIDRIYSTVQRAARAPQKKIGALLSDCRTAWSKSEENPYFNFQWIFDWQRKQGLRGAFYVLFEKRRAFRALLRGEPQHFLGVYSPTEIAQELQKLEAVGNEIGLHGSFDSWCDASALQAELKKMKSLGVTSVSGVRNHYLQYDDVKTPQAQRESGLTYDSTMGFNFFNGFRVGTCFPYLKDGVWELPFQLMDTALRFEAPSPSQRAKICSDVLSEVRSVGGVLVLNWHTQFMNDTYFPENIALLNGLIEQGKRDGAWFALPREVISWWAKTGEVGHV